jgi:hypothetical protein
MQQTQKTIICEKIHLDYLFELVLYNDDNKKAHL